ncbi:hypothetical protein QCA50_019057 [Cerrena zonata]|uniref:Epsilon-coat protein n=1 Tax=Cerrena zonata TaxID=2478898 RepID=A0AAW0FFX2_9APHY
MFYGCESIIYRKIVTDPYPYQFEQQNVNVELKIYNHINTIANLYHTHQYTTKMDAFSDSGHFKILNVLFVLTLKLKHYPEAKELIQSINALNLKTPNGDFIANQITLDYLDNDGANVDKLLEELKTVEPEHQLIVDLNEKNDAFDEIVGKYKVSA